jgi:hypothetical protein
MASFLLNRLSLMARIKYQVLKNTPRKQFCAAGTGVVCIFKLREYKPRQRKRGHAWTHVKQRKLM